MVGVRGSHPNYAFFSLCVHDAAYQRCHDVASLNFASPNFASWYLINAQLISPMLRIRIRSDLDLFCVGSGSRDLGPDPDPGLNAVNDPISTFLVCVKVINTLYNSVAYLSGS
jgi:hypothetical protein